VSEPTWADVLALVKQLDESGLQDAEVVTAGVSVRVSRTALPTNGALLPAPATPTTPPPPAPSPAPPSGPSSPAPAATGPEITAPMLGVVYQRPGPDQPPFVQVGDTVTPDTTVAIIEVMKLMNPVAAGVHGVVAEVCVPDGAMVEHGDVLFRLRAGRS